MNQSQTLFSYSVIQLFNKITNMPKKIAFLGGGFFLLKPFAAFYFAKGL
jgi:hypothetical protein